VREQNHEALDDGRYHPSVFTMYRIGRVRNVIRVLFRLHAARESEMSSLSAIGTRGVVRHLRDLFVRSYQDVFEQRR